MKLPCSLARCSVSAVAAACFSRAHHWAPSQAEQRPKVGYLGFGAAVLPTLFQNRLRGSVTRKYLFSVEYRFAEGRGGALPRLARELVDARVDVIMAMGDEAIVAAKDATRTVPIVFTAANDPIAVGLVKSLAAPAAMSPGSTRSPLR